MRLKSISIGFMLFFVVVSHAQVNRVRLQASGLTCSMCSNAINKSLKTLPYVEKVTADISNSSFDININDPAKVDFDQLKKKVEDAGFAVARMEVFMVFSHASISDDSHLELNGVNYHFLHTGNRILDGEQGLRILDKGFVSSKEFKKNSQYTSLPCYKSGYTGSCCKGTNKIPGSRIYHVTIS